jgi:CelD/BcsL family acetyltransferase involved in cellulose biosynthesis
MTADGVASLYISLYRKRWQCCPLGGENLADALRALSGLLCGFVLSVGERPIAVQLLFKVETPHWVLVDFVNQGVDPAFFSYSPGSVLLYLNLLQLEDDAISVGKELRFSFGYNDALYKTQWGYPINAYYT